MLHNVFHSCLSAAGVWVILYDEESVREEERGGRVGKGGGVNLGGHHHWSWIPLHQLLKVCSARMGTSVHANTRLRGFALSFFLLPAWPLFQHDYVLQGGEGLFLITEREGEKKK